MRTLASMEKELARLRARHTHQFKNCQWSAMWSTRQKIIFLLDCIVEHWPNWKEKNEYTIQTLRD